MHFTIMTNALFIYTTIFGCIFASEHDCVGFGLYCRCAHITQYLIYIGARGGGHSGEVCLANDTRQNVSCKGHGED